MPILETLRQLLKPGRRPETEPAAAYDIWAHAYDSQPDNLMLALDHSLCGELLSPIPLAGKTIVDVGCGTGRHWAAIFSQSPGRLIGYDVSRGMLDRLRSKYPDAETCLLSGTALSGLGHSSCDLVLSTLTVAHIPDLPAALAEWNRVLKRGGDMVITDYHPTALARGGQRTFREGERLIAIRNHIYPLSHVLSITRRLGLTEIAACERTIDESMRPWYERQNSLPVFHRFLGVPIIFGLHLKKADASQ
ncbi:MAG TPA: class I SAM-dependent methyltransferase [Puia sp.]|nr:class I SAM-dependent methyltransferase [Puia sp.]